MVISPLLYRSLRPLSWYLTSFHMSVHLPVDILDRSSPPGAQILRFARQNYATPVEEHDVIEEALDVGNHLCRHHHRTVSAEVGYQSVQDLTPRKGVQSAERLVQNVESRPACKDQRKPGLLDHPFGERTDLLVGSEPHDSKQFVEPFPIEVRVEVRIEVACLANGHPSVEMVHVRQKGHARLGFDTRRQTVDEDGPRRRRHQACQDLHERRLAATIRTE